MYTTLISAEQLKALQAGKDRVMVFDCSFELADPAAGEKHYLQAHIPGAVLIPMNDVLMRTWTTP